MGAFICQLSEKDWRVSREIGVYGNREGSERERTVVYFSRTEKGDQIIQSIIEDLIGMRMGDIVFFHVLREKRESTIHGIYRVAKEPFYNDNFRIWESSASLIYPYRFCFEPEPEHVELCRLDAHISVSDFYRSVENREIISVLTLEREVRGAAHAVKKILRSDAEEISKLLYRDFQASDSEGIVEFKPASMQMPPLRDHIVRIGEIEFAIKALVAYELGRKSPRVTEHIPACSGQDFDFTIETFLGQTMRKPTDIMCVTLEYPKSVTIIEAKTDRAEMIDLTQSLKYQEIFKLRNVSKGSLEYNYSTCLLARAFHAKLVEYVSVRNRVLPWEQVTLLRYVPTKDGRDADFEKQELPAGATSLFADYPRIPFRDLLSEAASGKADLYKIFGMRPLPDTRLKFESFENGIATLSKKHEIAGKETTLGHILICVLERKCACKDLSEFIRIVLDEAKTCFKGDLMCVEPVMVAEAYEDLLNPFIKTFNEFETQAQRRPIVARLGI